MAHGIKKIVSVRGLVVLILTLVLSYCVVNNTLSTEYITIYMVVISYLFGDKQGDKDD